MSIIDFGKGHRRLQGEMKDAGPYRVHKNANLYLDLGPACNAVCPFCITRTRTPYGGKPLQEGEWLAALGRLYKKWGDLFASVSFLGGEPLLYARKMAAALSIHERMHGGKSVATTNGIRREFLANLPLLCRFSHVNISRNASGEAANRALFKSSRPLLSMTDMKKLPAALKGRLRINANCLRGQIDSLGKIGRFVEKARRCGIPEVCFVELNTLDDGGYHPDVHAFTDRNMVDISPFAAAFARKGRIVKRVSGPYYHTLIVKDGGMTVLFKSNDMNHMRRLDFDASDENEIFELVFRPDGRLYGSWHNIKEIPV